MKCSSKMPHPIRNMFACMFILVCFLSACGQSESPGSAGSGGTASVGITITTKGANRQSASKTFQAAEAPASISEVRVIVTTTNNAELARDRATVTTGQAVILRLDVPVGTDRIFTVDAFDEEGHVQLFGRAVTDLVAGTQAVVLPITVSPPVTLDPEEAIVPTGQTQNFTASIHPQLNHSKTLWFVNDIPGGNATLGTITSPTSNTAIYTAPDVPLEQTIVVKAASDENPDLYFDKSPVTIANVRHVNRNTGNDTQDCGTENDPCRTITQGLSLAIAGNVVLVAPGTYPFGSATGDETSPLLLKSGVILRGQTLDDRPPIIDFIDPGQSNSTATGIVGADTATLENFTVQGSGLFDNLIQTQGTSPVIINNIFKARSSCADCSPGTEGSAILADTAGLAVIQGNTFGEDDFRGFSEAIHVSGEAAPLMTKNTFIGNNTAIEIIENAMPVLAENIISGNGIGVAVSGNAAPDLGRKGGSPGQNILSCNFNADLLNNTSTTLFAQNNQWDHVPPQRGSINDETSGIDIRLGNRESDVNSGGAQQYPNGNCNIGIRATPDAGLVTSEAGGTDGSDTFSVTLGTQPIADVVIALSSGTPGEGSVSPGRLTFTSTNWNRPQEVTITGVDDDIVDGSQGYNINLTATSEDLNYIEAAASVSATNTDNDLTLELTQTGSGRVTGEGTYDFGTSVSVSATPSSGSTFTGWTGPDAAECASGFVTMNADKSCTANFRIDIRTLTVAIAGAGSGNVISEPAGINCESDCTENYPVNTVVALTTRPVTGSVFVGWSGDPDCSDGSLTMNSNKTCTATFGLDTRTLTVITTGTGTGRVFSSPAGIDCGSGCTIQSADFNAGRNVNLTAEPAIDSDFTITDWSGCDNTGFRNCSVTMNANKTVTANFRSTAIFRAHFNEDDPAKPPNLSPPGPPERDRLELRLNPDLDGTILVQEKVGDLDIKPLLLNVSGEGRFGFDGFVSGDPPRSGVYLIRWRSLVTSTLTNANVTIIVRDSIRAFMTGLIYDEKVVSFIDQSVVPWQAGVSQLFEFTLDFDKKVSSLRVDGKDIYEGFEICGPGTETSCDLSEISITMTTNRPSPQGFAIDQIAIFKVP